MLGCPWVGFTAAGSVVTVPPRRIADLRLPIDKPAGLSDEQSEEKIGWVRLISSGPKPRVQC